VTGPETALDVQTRQDVADVLVRYATGIDRRDWTLFRSCFTDDCDADYGDIGHWHGADEITAWMERTHAPCGPTLHRISNPTVTRQGDGVVARSYVDALVLGPDGTTGFRAVGHYDDELRSGDGGWRIARRTYTSVLIEPVGGPPAAATTATPRVLDEIEAIKQLKARYFRTMDAKDWDAMRQVFTDGVVIDTTASGGGVVSGAEPFLAFLQEAIGEVVTVHHGHMPEIEVTSPTTATGVWAMEDMLRWPDGSELHGYGHYYETYEKDDGGWRIASSTLTRLRMDFAGPPPAAG
jgi:uncharacterized protein (TIGR02246 family)